MVAAQFVWLGLLIVALQTADHESVLYPYLAKAINQMAEVDQAQRNVVIEGKLKGAELNAAIHGLEEIDAQNTARMKELVGKFGWPTRKMVGAKAAGNAWLLVQHADKDPQFQRACLEKMVPLLKSQEVQPQNYAYLYDRVQVNTGNLQRFGTQGKLENGLAWIQPVENPKRLDAWRKEFGLEPIEEYLKMLAEAYHCKVAPDWRARLTGKR